MTLASSFDRGSVLGMPMFDPHVRFGEGIQYGELGMERWDFLIFPGERTR